MHTKMALNVSQIRKLLKNDEGGTIAAKIFQKTSGEGDDDDDDDDDHNDAGDD